MADDVLREDVDEVSDEEYFTKIVRTAWTIDQRSQGFVVSPVEVWQYKRDGKENHEWIGVEKGSRGPSMYVHSCDIYYTTNDDLEGHANVIYFDRDVAYDAAIRMQNELVNEYVKGLNELRRAKRKRDHTSLVL